MRATDNTLIILLAALVVSVSTGRAQQPKNEATPIKVDPASKARIVFIDKYWDFGVVPRGYAVYHNFELSNVGRDTLVITGVKPTCGCTAAPLSSDRIAPGDTAKISVSLDTSKLNGKVRKFVNVDCNDPINPYYKLTFDARIDSLQQIISFEPLVADFGDFKSEQAPKIELKVTNTSGSALNLAIVDKPDNRILTAVFGREALDPGKSTTLNIELVADVEPGPFASTVAVQSGDDSSTRISVPILGNVVK